MGLSLASLIDETTPETASPALLEDGLGLSAADTVARGARIIAIGPAAWERIRAAQARLARAIAERRVVYGVTTGFGPLADRLVRPEDVETLQRNLIYHLATGVGAPLSWEAARATALARLCSIAQGWSGASDPMVEALVALLNSDLAPWIPEKGTVGASGDLTPLSHLALALMGEGAFIDRAGNRIEGGAGLARIGVPPLTLAARDGLALVNGTAAMTGIAVLNGARAAALLEWAEALTGLHAELLRGRSEAWDPALSAARPHPGQVAASDRLRARIEGAPRIDATRAAERILPQSGDAPPQDATPLQDPYSIRCAPQILGAARDALSWHDAVIERELNSASDNPIFAEDAAIAVHGGNFMGCHAALASDALKNAVVLTAVLSERQIARLTDEKRNGGLPPFLNRGRVGLESGLMGAQVTASALVAEMRAFGGPASTQSISTNGANQDVVSLGTIAARGCADILEDAARVLAIQAIAVAQGADIVGREALSPAGGALAERIRSVVAPLTSDRPLHADIERLSQEIVEQTAGQDCEFYKNPTHASLGKNSHQAR
ncbi:MAG: aromatic amino acid ammonia-lyase [Pseudomonadota bacterium]